MQRRKDPDPQFILSRRGKPIMEFLKHRYIKHGTSIDGSKVRWVCSSQSRKRCKAVIWTYNKAIINGSYKHTHPPVTK
ncbi:Uncharacterized protein OBRU01_23575 [Operophtera brumata]|uniref:FLYWCH-type domain-containing protein n=1 Tax=Operophtera brumata TaxID=104452 RepID=A0A0L7KPF6_OPEBR|nr:Uncharacterized protein OBRU01_23575 [Operophtera brumata]